MRPWIARLAAMSPTPIRLLKDLSGDPDRSTGGNADDESIGDQRTENQGHIFDATASGKDQKKVQVIQIVIARFPDPSMPRPNEHQSFLNRFSVPLLPRPLLEVM